MQNAALKNEEFQKTDTRKVPNILFAGQLQKELYDKHKKTISQQIEDYGFECVKRNWLKLVRLHAKGKATVTAVALAISDHTNRADGLCWPSISTIAKEAGVSRSSVFNALRLLKRRKMLFCPKTESRIKKSNHYILMIDNQYLSLLEGGSAKITLDESRGVVQKLDGGSAKITPELVKITPKEKTHTRARENDLFLEIMEKGGANSNQQEQEIADTSIGLQDIKDNWLPFIALHAGLIIDDTEFNHFKRHQRGPSVYADFTPRMQKLVNITQAFTKKYLESGSYVAADDPHIPQTIGRALKRKLTGKPWRPSEIYLHDGEHFKFTQEMAQNVRQDDDLRDLSDDEITEAARKYDRKLGSHGDETRDPVERRLNVFKAHYLEKVLGRKLAEKIRKERKNKHGHDGVNRG